jgi:hypothetical protein
MTLMLIYAMMPTDAYFMPCVLMRRDAYFTRRDAMTLYAYDDAMMRCRRDAYAYDAMLMMLMR